MAPASRANTLAWILSAVVIVAGIVMWLTTDRPLFLVFTALGLLTVLNVVVYDRMVLRRKGTEPKRTEQSESTGSTGSTEPGDAAS